jgi:iron complex outermembrane receptor protein
MNTAAGSSIVLRTAVVLALFGAAPLAGAADPVAATDSLALEEVVVTATKVAQDIDSAPAAITAIAESALGPGGIQEVRDLAMTVPNLSVGDQFGVNRTFIRGIGMTSIDLGADGAVAFLQDGAMIPRRSKCCAAHRARFTVAARRPAWSTWSRRSRPKISTATSR